VNVRAGRRALLGMAVVGGALAPFAGSPYRGRRARLDVDRLAGMVERQEDHVSALELARWIKDRRPGLRVLDLRPPEEFDAGHIPGAQPVALGALASLPLAEDDTVVLVSDGGGHAAQGWVFLQALGHRRCYFLRGGMGEWQDEVMSPVEGDARASALARYFGGAVRPAGAAPLARRRGGC